MISSHGKVKMTPIIIMDQTGVADKGRVVSSGVRDRPGVSESDGGSSAKGDTIHSLFL
jgi:hypothetical protein